MSTMNPPHDPALILLIEDNPAHAEIIQRGLESGRISCRVIHVADGEQALDYLHQRGAYATSETSPRPSLILLDLRLPKVDGLEVLKEIRASRLDGMPVVVLTSSAAEADMAKAYDYHASSYLVKPLDFSKFRNLLDDLSYYWLRWNQCLWDHR